MASVEEEVAELERQVQRSSMFTQASLDQVLGRLAGTESFLTGLVDILRAKGILGAEDVEEDPGPDTEAEEETQAEGPAEPERSGPVAGGEVVPAMDAAEVMSWPSVAVGVEPEDPPVRPPVNCAERMHICHAVCCKLSFALTADEIDAGTVRWDLGFPYLIRHNASGYCVHNEVGTHRCGVYADRPGVCRRYSCAGDGRIWKDFEAMELNEEWLGEHLRSDRIRIRRPEAPGG
jgi:Fe-S-cluster containining protein